VKTLVATFPPAFYEVAWSELTSLSVYLERGVNFLQGTSLVLADNSRDAATKYEEIWPERMVRYVQLFSEKTECGWPDCDSDNCNCPR
jgi:hypothetical protein